jgi:hypothetical protein
MANAADSSPRRLHPALLAAGFLFPLDRLRQSDSPLWASTARWLIPWGFLIGLAYLFIFRVTWKWFGEYQQVRWLPAAAVLAADLAFCGHRMLASITRMRRGHCSEPPGTPEALTLRNLLAVLLITIVKYAMLLSLPVGRVLKAASGMDWYLPSQTRWLCPDEVLYRPLMLMPVWGRWAIGLAASIGRISPSEPERIRQMAAGLSLPTILAQWAGITFVTMAYCALNIPLGAESVVFISSGRTLAYGLLISLIVMLCSYLASFLMARLRDGQTESSILVAGLVAEMAFLTLYLHLANLIYWF